MNEGNMQIAVQLWQEILKINPDYGPAHLNMSHFFRTQNNLIGEKEELNRFLECPLTGKSLPMVQGVNDRLKEIEEAQKPKQA